MSVARDYVHLLRDPSVGEKKKILAAFINYSNVYIGVYSSTVHEQV